MPRRYNDNLAELDPPRKKTSNTIVFQASRLEQGEKITDLSGTEWWLGKTIGVGGFGQIYLTSKSPAVKTNTSYVAKVEKHSNGPLFVEINCYLRIGRKEMIEKWKKVQKLTHLGMPYYIGSGSHTVGNDKYRFLIMPRYATDLEGILQSKQFFNLKTVLTIAYQITDVLQYIHSNGYIHSDIKAGNILLELSKTRKPKRTVLRKRHVKQVDTLPIMERPRRLASLRPLRPVNYNDEMPNYETFSNFVSKGIMSSPKLDLSSQDKIYLLDYGLAKKYLDSAGQHREFCTDERKAHAGTIPFCSRDAHKGIQSRRSDLESLGFNMVFWLTGTLPWQDHIEDVQLVERQKNKCLLSIPKFLSYCFKGEYPNFLNEYFTYVEKLQFEESPDYNFCRLLFNKALNEYGFDNDMRVDLDSLEPGDNRHRGQENVEPISMGSSHLLSTSNVLFKRPKLRKKTKNKKVQHNSMMNWSKILVDNPEDIYRAGREKKYADSCELEGSNILNMDIKSMNPTYAMLDVYNKYVKVANGESFSSINHIEGYTSAMMSVYIKKIERETLEEEKIATDNGGATKRSKNRRALLKRKCVAAVKSDSPKAKTRRGKTQTTASKKAVSTRKSKSVPIRTMRG